LHKTWKEFDMYRFLAAFLAAFMLLGFGGCKQTPESRGGQGAVRGGVSGAAAGGATSGESYQLVSPLIGGALGAGADYIVGANSDRLLERDYAAATQATQNAKDHPATAQAVRNSNTADLNHDGFVTMDEIVAMQQAGLKDQQMLQRLREGNQVFEVTSQQAQYLRDHGINQYVISQMERINSDKRQQLLKSQRNPAPTAPQTLNTPPTAHINTVPQGTTTNPAITVFEAGPNSTIIEHH
jgi:hypothetical protein